MTTAASFPDAATPNHSLTGRLWRWVAAVSIFGNIFLNAYSNIHPFHGQTMAQVSAKYPTLVTPAGYAFSIWGIIFLALAVYAVWQLLPAQHKLSLPDAIAKPLTVANLACAAWIVLFAYELIMPSVWVMLLILGSLAITYGEARRQVFTGAAPSLASVPFSLFLGWISVATAVNITIGIRLLSWEVAEDLSTKLTLGVLVIIVLLALLISRIFRDMVFPLVVAWALVGIWVVRLREDLPDLAWGALAGATVVTIAGVVLARLGGRKQPWELRDQAAAAAEAEIAARNSVRAAE
ncbi:tryptophan-rich sensory protein [Hymenobacter sp. BT664]|uniref:Tryptophan-rich sensory protein n=1 Tax=Hymenobacter montanus TaxID=2771359 RepID=A0A927BEV2_9BACT|nr:tryptophan-rich sensory protein [Hymenobacter montanus]MBD2768752.1 tryptophan-rich sensory protein [Hymenobacter montanus]